ncbi:response regulator [Aurantimonas endophytica]|uniref:Two-component system KDP operon response regulator KdpE n=1 Tax=Aurantimonas endophytica TaxID=1522175 RepID=A0A7W6HA06_9HYPH|nr:response regulator transcription factor [Aurantimonas endophytica]MBB4001374.1 two-component system KDP operon response regulator KdpE [Aurantimonas endophytica]MCO6402983.1 response regulator [Aurantimonas endophytica]
MSQRILVVDDEPQIRRFLKIALEAHGFEVVEAVRGEDGVAKTATTQPDLVVLDLGLPDFDGKMVVQRIREWSQVPILILSVRQAESEKVAALDAGANDYVVKPFGIAELLARMRVLLRTRDGAAPVTDVSELRFGGLELNLATHEVTLDGESIRLTRKEFELLRYLAANAGRIVTHNRLLTEIWGPAHGNDLQYLRVFIGRIRAKLKDDPADPRFILNEPGVGYRFLES